MNIVHMMLALIGFITLLGFAYSIGTELVSKYKSFRIERQAQKTEFVMDELNANTKIILTQYMEPMVCRGKWVYGVSDIKKFNAMIESHISKNEFNYSRCDIDKCIKDSLKDGSGFIFFMNGKEYVAFPPIHHINADCFIK